MVNKAKNFFEAPTLRIVYGSRPKFLTEIIPQGLRRRRWDKVETRSLRVNLFCPLFQAHQRGNIHSDESERKFSLTEGAEGEKKNILSTMERLDDEVVHEIFRRK